jgi:hypothetical protein
MTTIYDGGPANPIGNESGISIRDYFATAIMTGVYSSGGQATITAEDAYRAANLMLTARTADLYPVAVPVVTPTVEETPVVEETPTEPTA